MPRRIVMMMSVFVAGTAAFAGEEGACLPAIDPGVGQPGLNSSAFAVTTYDDGSGTALYAGGFFTQAGGVAVARVARWDGMNWHDVGGGVAVSAGVASVRALHVVHDGDQDSLIVGGAFDQAGSRSTQNIARWDGTNWSALGGGLDDMVLDVTVFDDGTGPAIYAATTFFNTDNGGVWKFDGNAWSVVGLGVNPSPTTGQVNALEVFDDGSGARLVAGGIFTIAGGKPVAHIAQWDGESWTDVGGGLNEPVWSLQSFDDGNGPALFVGGTFLGSAGGVPAVHAARWSGSQWSSLGNEDFLEFFGIIAAMTVFDFGDGPALYLTGADGFGPEPIFRWTGGPAWTVVTDELSGSISAITSFDDGTGPALYIAGGFSLAGGDPIGGIVRWTDCPAAIPGDIDGDGIVGINDFLTLLAVWGPCADCGNCPADLDGDCSVGINDLLGLLANWS